MTQPNTASMVFVGTQGGKVQVFNITQEFTPGEPNTKVIMEVEHGAVVQGMEYYQDPGDPAKKRLLTAGWRGMPEDPPVHPEIVNGNEDNELPPEGDNPGRIEVWKIDGGKPELTFNVMK